MKSQFRSKHHAVHNTKPNTENIHEKFFHIMHPTLHEWGITYTIVCQSKYESDI